MKIRYSKYLPAFIYFNDVVLLNIAFLVANEARGHAYFVYHNIAPVLVQANLFWLIVSTACKSYSITRPLQPLAHLKKLVITLGYHFTGVLGTIYFLRIYQVPRFELLIFYLLFFAAMLISRSATFVLLDYIRRKGYNHRRVVIIGDGGIYSRISKVFKSHPEYGYGIASHINQNGLDKLTREELGEFLLKSDSHEILLCYKEINEDKLDYLIAFAKANSVKLKLVSDLVFSDGLVQLVNYENIPVLTVLTNPHMNRNVRLAKRSFDIFFSLSVMTLGAPVFVLVYLITKFSSEGPAFYKQERVGKNGRPFNIYKFRSMYINSESMGPQLSRGDHDPRITKWGRIIRRSRLDELPQFWNVIKGDMAVVGPRPERQHFIDQIVQKQPGYQKLLCIKPGVTSIGQVQYGYAETVDQMCDRMIYDLQYLKNMKVNHDLNIIMQTIKVMVQLKGK